MINTTNKTCISVYERFHTQELIKAKFGKKQISELDYEMK